MGWNGIYSKRGMFDKNISISSYIKMKYMVHFYVSMYIFKVKYTIYLSRIEHMMLRSLKIVKKFWFFKRVGGINQTFLIADSQIKLLLENKTFLLLLLLEPLQLGFSLLTIHRLKKKSHCLPNSRNMSVCFSSKSCDDMKPIFNRIFQGPTLCKAMI